MTEMALADGETRGLLTGEMEDCHTELCFHQFSEFSICFQILPTFSTSPPPYRIQVPGARRTLRCCALQDVAAEAEKLLALDVRKVVSWHHYLGF